jgi:protein-tyrosine-phosphatase
MKTSRAVLFVCLHGSAKSVIAAEYFARLVAERGLNVHATSAGTEPDPDIPPHVIEELLRDGIDVRGRRPRLVTREELANASHVVSFGCDLSRVAPPGLAIERWDDVPAVSADFATARDAIVARLRRLLVDWESSKRAG